MGKLLNKAKLNEFSSNLKSNKLFKPICVALILLMLFVMSLVIINTLIPVEYSSYVVSSENVQIDIDSSNKALFTDTYDVTFSTPKANFEIVIPTKNDKGYYTKIKSIKAEGYNISKINTKENVKVIINVEADDNELQKSQYQRNITLTYVVDNGEDFDNDFDYINYFIASPYRGFKLSNLKYKINFPKNIKSSVSDLYSLFSKIDSNNLEASISKQECRISLTDDGNSITGQFSNGLSSYEGIKINHNVYNQYFENTRNPKNDENKLIGLYIIFFFICFINFFLCGKDATMIYKASSEIPSNISPLLAALFITDDKKEEERINDYEFKHISSLLIKWANEGYLSIEPFKVPLTLDETIANSEKELEMLENENNNNNNNEEQKEEKITKKNIFNKSKNKNDEKVRDYKIEFRFRKLKEAMRSNMPYFEKYIFDSLFTMNVNGCVDTYVIRNNKQAFKECLDYFKNQYNLAKTESLKYADKVKSSFIDQRAKRMKNDLKIISYVMWVVALFFQTILYYTETSSLIIPILFLIILAIYYFGVLSYDNKVNTIGALLILILAYFMLKLNIISFILLASTTVMLVVIRKYTFEYELIVEKIKSFKRFLFKKGDRTGIVNALNENPKFFYEALPLAIVMKGSDILIERCKEFNLAMPGWLIIQPDEYKVAVIKDLDKDLNDIWNDYLNIL